MGSFSDNLGKFEDALIIDAYPLLISAGVFLWGDADEQLLDDYIRQLHGIIKRIEPLMIYLFTGDLASALNRKLDLLQRDKLEHQFLITMDNLPFLQNRGISGCAGVLVLWKKVNQMLNQYYLAARDRCLVIDRDSLDEAKVRALSEKFLWLSQAA